MKRISILVLVLLLAAFLPFGCKQTANQTRTNTTHNDDSRITSEVKARISTDPTISDKKIDVDTDDGVVTLSGDVQNQAQADAALKLANNVNGVRSVRSHIKVEPEETAENTGNTGTIGGTGQKESLGEQAKDAGITAKVKLELTKLDGSDISVDTNNQSVTLTGTVRTKADENRAIRLARSVDDVRNVISNLTVKSGT